MSEQELRVTLSRLKPGSFIVFRTDDPEKLCACFHGKVLEEWQEKKFTGGVILGLDEQIDCLSDRDLSRMGLVRKDLVRAKLLDVGPASLETLGVKELLSEEA